MPEPRFDLEFSLSDVARMLGVPVATLHTWRHRDLLPKFSESRLKTLRCGLGEILAIEIMRALTSEQPPVAVTSASWIAIMCAGRFWARKGRIDRGNLFLIEPGLNGHKGFVSADGLAEHVRGWAGQAHHTRLELIDVRHVALRVGAKMARFQDQDLRDELSEEETMQFIEPFFEKGVSEYIEREIEKESLIMAEEAKRYR
jgi:hypothetical protein